MKPLKYNEWLKLNESSNGQLSKEDLTPITVKGQTSGEHALNSTAAAAYEKMVAAAKKEGVEWGITDSYRTYDVQNRIFDWDFFKRTNKKRKKGTSGTPVAYPGTSNHGWGSAVDLKVKYGDAAHTWLTQNASKFGFSNPFKNPKTEPWHWEHVESAKSMKSGAPSTPIEPTMGDDSTKTDTDSSPIVNSLGDQTIRGNTPGERILNNQIIVNWLFRMLPEIATTVTPQQLDQTFNDKPEHFKWFKEKFGLDDDGQPVGSPKLTSSTEDKNNASDAIMAGNKIKSKYTGKAAENIDLLISELNKQGVTNKYTIVGILSTIGKESGFIPKNEIPYTNTPNSRIRKIFGSRVKGLTEDQLTALKKDPTKFWDRVYGSDDPTGRSQKLGNSQPGDGAKYLGRGFNGITFKSGYEKYGKIVGLDLVSNPDQLNDPIIAAKAAVAYFLNGLKAKGVDPNSFTNKRDAIKTFVQLNAGGGVNIEGSETLAKAEEVSNKFDIT